MKGQNNLIVVGILGLIALFAVSQNPEILNLGATFGTCQLLLPQYANYECLSAGEKQVTYNDDNSYACGLFGASRCIDQFCDYADMNPGTRCTLTSEANIVIANGQALSSGQSATFAHGELIKTEKAGGGSRFRIAYESIYLRFENTLTGRVDTANGCDLSSQDLPYEQTRYLPSNLNLRMTVGESDSYVAGFDSFPIYGNFVTYKGQQAICERESDTSATVYSLDQLTTRGAGCYYFPGSVLGTEDCCPGTSFGSQVCNDNFKFGTIGEEPDVGCCKGGICSPVNGCPGSGGWEYVDDFAYKYVCSESGKCVVSETRSIECYFDSDCSPGLSCDRGTNKCVSKVIPVSCTAAGHECCAVGMFAPNVEIRSCQDAGFGDDFVCLNGKCASNEEIASGGCAWFDIICHLQGIWNALVSWLTGTFAAIGVIAIIVVIALVFFMFVMPRRP